MTKIKEARLRELAKFLALGYSMIDIQNAWGLTESAVRYWIKELKTKAPNFIDEAQEKITYNKERDE